MKTVLVTGVDGFTGRHMVRQLSSQNFKVVGLGVTDVDYADESVVCDLTDKLATTNAILSIKPEWVIHLAAMSFVAHGNTDDIYRVNILGTKNLLEALEKLENKPDAILLASSANVYGNATSYVLDESAALTPCNDYGVSKLSMEYLARLWVDKLPIMITRPFNYTGLGQNRQFLIPKVVDHFVRKASVIELGNIDVEREFGDVRIVCQIYQKLLEQPSAVGKTFNICSGLAYSLREVIRVMERIAGYQIKVEINQGFVRENEIKRLVGNNSLLHSVIGQQAYPRIEETLEWMFEKPVGR
jgi:GDP-6-deoxy-D-talose 4-dehydrogenase